MAIVLNCPKCNLKLNLDDDRADSMMECPKCDARIDVPSASASNPSVGRRPTRPKVVRYSQGRTPRVPSIPAVAAVAPPPVSANVGRIPEEVFLDWKGVKVTSHRLIINDHKPTVYAMRHITDVETFRIAPLLPRTFIIVGAATAFFGSGVVFLIIGLCLLYSSEEWGLRVHTSGEGRDPSATTPWFRPTSSATNRKSWKRS